MPQDVFDDIQSIVTQLREYKVHHPGANKAEIEAFFSQVTKAPKQRSVFACRNFAFRFSEANAGSFSNVVLSLSALRQYDSDPFIVCIVRPSSLGFLLANTTFLKKISHSSHTLSQTNIKGSFLGHDISSNYEDVTNRAEHFEQLFALHAAFTWSENIERLVAATNSIAPRLTRFNLTDDLQQTILSAPRRAASTLETSQTISNIEESLATIVDRNSEQLLAAAQLENVNLRGNAIEQIITSATNEHRLDDLIFTIPGGRLIVDIKTKLLDRASAPKGYNIDKVLRLLSDGTSQFAFFFIGINSEARLIRTRLVSIFDPLIVRATRIQTHWAGRNSRGVTQLTGDLTGVFRASYRTSVSEKEAESLLRSFIER